MGVTFGHKLELPDLNNKSSNVTLCYNYHFIKNDVQMTISNLLICEKG